MAKEYIERTKAMLHLNDVALTVAPYRASNEWNTDAANIYHGVHLAMDAIAELPAADAIEELAKDLELSKEYETFWNNEAEEALEFISAGCDYMFPDCPAHDSCRPFCAQLDACRKGWLDWLKQEAGE